MRLRGLQGLLLISSKVFPSVLRMRGTVGVVECWVYCVILAGVIFLCVRHLPAKHLDCRALLTGGGLHRLRDRLAWGGMGWGYSRGLLFSSRIIRRGKLRAGGQHLRPAGQRRAV